MRPVCLVNDQRDSPLMNRLGCRQDIRDDPLIRRRGKKYRLDVRIFPERVPDFLRIHAPADASPGRLLREDEHRSEIPECQHLPC